MSHLHQFTSGGPLLRRRTALLGLGAALTLGRASVAFAAGTSTKRLVVINTMGGLDGLSLVAPYGDPNLAKLRSQIMAPQPGQPGGMFDLGGFYGLHPAMPNLYAMFQEGQAAMVHAVGNEDSDRSHFQGQDYLQGGVPETTSSGWLNRLASLVPAAPGMQSGINMSNSSPLLVRGASILAGWAPDPFPQISPGFVGALVSLLQPDPLLGPAYSVGFEDRSSFNADFASQPIPQGLSQLQTLAFAAGDILSNPNGPRIAAIATPSFDTHDQQVSRLQSGLSDLDGAILHLKTALGSAWADTVVLTMTEFGRTAYANGDPTCGTDHGTAFAVLLAGGAVNGGKVYGQWPGLSSSQLYQGRDLAPTADFRSVAMGVLQGHLGISGSGLAQVFPASGVSPMGGLVSG
jgi:uncharacterized protein (DUF1501 family)